MKMKLTITSVKTLTPSTKPYEVLDTEIKGFLLRVQPSGSMTYYLSYRNKANKRSRYKIGTNSLSPTQARDIAEKLAGKIANNEDIQTNRKSDRAKGMQEKLKTLEGFINNRYEEWVTTHRKSGVETIKTIKRHFNQFYQKPLSEINPWIIDKWRSDRKKAGISASTINRDIASLKSALSKAVEWRIIDTHPLSALKPFKTDGKVNVRYLSDHETASLRKALIDRDNKIINERENANRWREKRGYDLYPDITNYSYADHLTPMTLLTINTGLRRGEMFDLKWTDINLDTKTLTIHGKTAKSGQTRHIPLNHEVIKTLTQWKIHASDNELIFPNKKGNRFHTIKRSWASIIKSAGITGFRWHDLRHDFASKLVMAGVPLNTVRELLGHTDLKTTLRYAHLAPDHKADAVERLSMQNNQQR
ncbi:MAG: hypothetical protein DIZ80_03220 [endosymbiont of Galathealinum brachiosum]|uniref:Integrase n=1 Tax=endosymbiont of Galathealinum brachiosum TaxID=2200906 RepID=A0A370DJF9_9GAMM|nr:MAG: hypothetical protein DIZ80_03220 [endosymbiont of Galathealinum brachiosum]